MSTASAQPSTFTSSPSTDQSKSATNESSQSTANASHWTRTKHVAQAPIPLITEFHARVALSARSDASQDVVDGIAAAEARFDREVLTLAPADRDSLELQAENVLSSFALTETQRSEIEATRSAFHEEYRRDMVKLQQMKDQEFHSVPDYTAEIIDKLKKTTSASEAALTIMNAERVLSGLDMYPVPASTARTRLFSSLRNSGVLTAEAESTVKTWFNQYKQDRWKMGLDVDVAWVER